MRFAKRWDWTDAYLEPELQIIIRDKILNAEMLILEPTNKDFTENKRQAIFLEILCKYCNQVNTDALLLAHFKKISFSESWISILSKIEYVLLNLGDAPQTYSYIKDNFITIIEKLIFSISEHKNAIQIPFLFEKYEHYYEDYIENSENGFENIIGMISSVLEENEEDIKSQYAEDLQDIDAVSDLYNDLYILEEDLLSNLFPNISISYDFNISMDMDYWQAKVEDNKRRLDEKSSRLEDYDADYYDEIMHERRSEDNTIDDLFSKND